jgi:hypothetical protein
MRVRTVAAADAGARRTGKHVVEVQAFRGVGGPFDQLIVRWLKLDPSLPSPVGGPRLSESQNDGICESAHSSV